MAGIFLPGTSKGGDISGVTAGVGLSGGGDSGGVTLTLDLSELSAVVPTSGDWFGTLDSDDANEQLTTTDALATLFAGDGLAASSAVLGLDLVTNGGLEISSNKLQVATGISQYDVAQFAASVADNDFLRIATTSVEGRSASEVLSDISAAPAAGDGNILTVGALDSGSITSGFTSIDVGSGGITTTGAIAGGTIDASTDFTIGDTVITNGVITDTSGLQLAANLDINGTADISGDLTLSAGADGALRFSVASSIKILDNSTTALVIEEADNALMTFSTEDDLENVTFDVPMVINADPADAHWSGITAKFTAGEDLEDGECVYLKAADNKMWKAVANTGGTGLVTAEIMCVAMCASDVAADAVGVFLLQGFIRANTNFPTYAIGENLYLPEAEVGGKNVPEGIAPDSTNDFVQVIGWAAGVDTVYFSPNFTMVKVA